MQRTLALLGSVNVGGNRIKMADLRRELESRGFAKVETVAASGNILFDGNHGAGKDRRSEIAGVLREVFGFESLVVLCDPEQLVSAIEDNPFHGRGEDRFVHTIFLDGQPDETRFDALLAEHREKGSERLALGDRVLYLDYVHGVGVSSLTGPFLYRRLGCRGTARNMTSLKRILDRLP
ncbi:DUF1697 domain-containing protein [Qipengyuania zhejiangensis]|uniref:DUF1697 domain-containing protein n=1 Tax=Qipengyuania zhejiangensis TaxID=3077782 RepID=UPI002D786737|nr:DUF1697 domain-containing protein [Qipengyuania sp. Z2]